MKFTSKTYVIPVICGFLIITAGGRSQTVNGRTTLPPTVAVQDASAASRTFTANDNPLVTPAVEYIPLADAQRATANDLLAVTWYKSKHWWKKNAPIIGGAAGGGLIGGLAGGGAGAVIGGAAGAGGGYLYKHYKDHHHHHHHDTEYRNANPTPDYYEHSAPAPVKR